MGAGNYFIKVYDCLIEFVKSISKNTNFASICFTDCLLTPFVKNFVAHKKVSLHIRYMWRHHFLFAPRSV